MNASRPRVLVVGAGIAGAAAALGAIGDGCTVAGLERDSAFGGTAARAGGGYCAINTRAQQQQGIKDSLDLALADLRRGQEDEVDTAWARKYLRMSPRLVHDVINGLGVETAEIMQFERDSVPRWHRPAGGGAALMAGLRRRLEAGGHGNLWSFGLRLKHLQLREGRITGVIAVDPGGRERTLDAEAVILATGGFAQNAALVAQHGRATVQGRTFLTAGGTMAQGDALAALTDIGAALTGLDRVYFYAFITADTRQTGRGVAVRGLDRGIWLNRALERFLDERTISLGQSAAKALFRQPGSECWAVVDRRSFEDIVIADHFAPAPEPRAVTLARFIAGSPDFVQAETPEGLAALMGVEGQALSTAVANWNALVASGATADPLTGRPLMRDDRLDQPPFLAVRLRPGARKTLGGVRTDLRCRVLARDGQAIPGLYAAGEVAGFAGGSIAGRTPLEGMMVGASFLAGLIAGRAARRFVRRGQAATL